MFSRSIIQRRAGESMRCCSRYLSSGGTGGNDKDTKLTPGVQAVPKPNEITRDNAQFDQITHTGQVYQTLIFYF